MKRVLYYIFFIFCIFFMPKNILAESYNMSITCPSTAAPNEVVSCELYLSNPTFEITSLSGSYNFSGGIAYNSFNSSIFTSSGDSSNLSLNSGSINSSSQVGILKLHVPETANSNDTLSVSINSIYANGSFATNPVNASIRVKSSDNTLQSLSLSNATFDRSFSPDVENYNAIVNDSTTIISASANSNTATVAGTGEKTLDYGSNSFQIIVTSETGTPKIYTINISRQDTRSKGNYLSSLMVTNTNIEFNKTKTEYNLSTTSSEVIISASKEDSTSSFTGDVGKKSLSYGLNKYSIKVVAENGDIRNYILNITRVDTRSNNNYLKSITLSKGNIKFNKTTTTYNINVDADVDKIHVVATLDDSKSKIIDGELTRDINLKLGNNTIYFKIENEKSELRTYTLNINRDDGRSSDATLKELTLSTGEVDFKPDKYEYKISVEYNVETIKINAKANSDKSKVTIDEKETLEVGENTFNIVVEAENGAKNTYIVTVIRKKDGDELSSDNYIKYLVIKNYDFVFDKKTYKYKILTKEDILDITVILDDENASYEIIGNEGLSNGSEIIIKVTAENGDTREYTLTIEKQTNTVIILIMIFLTLLAGSLVYLIILRMRRRAKLNSMYKTKVEVIDEDFVQI